MTFFTVIVTSFVIFLVLYGRYMNANGDISKRRIQLDNLRDQVEFRVKKLRQGTEQINKEIGEIAERLESLNQTYQMSMEEDNDS